MKLQTFAAAIISGITCSKALKIASISDIHLMPMYDAYRSNDKYCWPDSGTYELSKPAFFG